MSKHCNACDTRHSDKTACPQSLDDLLLEVEELRKDKERLEWMFENMRLVECYCEPPVWCVQYFENGEMKEYQGNFNTPREAIDAAMFGEKPFFEQLAEIDKMLDKANGKIK